jgi:acetyl-CoA carboxylase biotin carboxyl carrier protein
MSKDEAVKSAMRVDTDLIRQLADLLTEKDLTEIEVEDGDRKVVVKRTLVTAPPPAPAPSTVVAHTAPAASAAAPAEAASAGPGGAGVVKSPMVGTAYLSPEPGAAPFAPVGKAVKEGETLLIIEAMKVMNPIPAPKAGVVREVLVQDAQPVEFDQPLVVIE